MPRTWRRRDSAGVHRVRRTQGLTTVDQRRLMGGGGVLSGNGNLACAGLSRMAVQASEQAANRRLCATGASTEASTRSRVSRVLRVLRGSRLAARGSRPRGHRAGRACRRHSSHAPSAARRTLRSQPTCGPGDVAARFCDGVGRAPRTAGSRAPGTPSQSPCEARPPPSPRRAVRSGRGPRAAKV